MAFSRVSMRKIREILRLHLQAGFPQGHLVRLCPIPPSGRPSRMGGWIPSAWQAQSSSAARAWASAVPRTLLAVTTGTAVRVRATRLRAVPFGQ